MTLSLSADCGVGLESGVFVSSVSPGSPAARDGSVCPGDRVLNVSYIFSELNYDPNCVNLWKKMSPCILCLCYQNKSSMV